MPSGATRSLPLAVLTEAASAAFIFCSIHGRKLNCGSSKMSMLDQIVATREQPVKESIDLRTIAACQQGDRAALRVLFEEYKDRVYSIAIYSMSGDEMAAADITQQVFLKLMTRIKQFRGDSEFTTWLY